MSAVLASRVTRRFGDFTAVDSVDLTVEPGEVVGVLGSNGAGKTTLIRMILGLLAPTEGTVAVFGSPPSRSSRLRTGYVPQGLGLWRDLSATENLAFAAGVFGVPPSPPPPGAGEGLVGDLSLGVQRQIAFTAALQHRPDLLVLDEPTSGVAPLARARLWEKIRAEAEAGAAVLVTTHYMDEARQADRLMLMARGREVASGGERDIVGDTQAVVVSTDHWDDAFDALDAAGFGATLAGRDVRVPGADPETVRSVLRRAGLRASVEATAATLEEAMVMAAHS